MSSPPPVAVRAGTVGGPQLWVASPQLTGRASENAIVTTTDAEAREAGVGIDHQRGGARANSGGGPRR